MIFSTVYTPVRIILAYMFGERRRFMITRLEPSREVLETRNAVRMRD